MLCGFSTSLFLPSPLLEFCTAGQVWFCMWRRLDFVDKDVALQSYRLQHVSSYVLHHSWSALRESNTHLFCQSKSLLPVGSHRLPMEHMDAHVPILSFDTKSRFSVAGWIAAIRIQRRLLIVTPTFCYDQHRLVPAANEISCSGQMKLKKKKNAKRNEGKKDGLSHLSWSCVSQKLSKLLTIQAESLEAFFFLFVQSCRQDFPFRRKHLQPHRSMVLVSSPFSTANRGAAYAPWFTLAPSTRPNLVYKHKEGLDVT